LHTIENVSEVHIFYKLIKNWRNLIKKVDNYK
jgi:hypothetical protein